MQNQYFGRAWNPNIAQLEQAPLPIGEPCQHCAEPIADGDSGLLMPGPMHVECLLRNIHGSVAHQLQKCCCFGGTEDDDPPGMTKREAARQALEFFEKPTLAELKDTPSDLRYRLLLVTVVQEKLDKRRE